MFTTKSIV